MDPLHIPWQAVIALSGICCGAVFVVLYCMRLYARDGLKSNDRLAWYGGSPHPKIVPLINQEGVNLSILGRKGGKVK